MGGREGADVPFERRAGDVGTGMGGDRWPG